MIGDNNIKNKFSLIQDIADGLKAYKGCRVLVCDVRVTLVCDEERFDFDLPAALDVLANDLYWDERGNWAEATSAIVEVCQLKDRNRRELPAEVIQWAETFGQEKTP